MQDGKARDWFWLWSTNLWTDVISTPPQLVISSGKGVQHHIAQDRDGKKHEESNAKDPMNHFYLHSGTTMNNPISQVSHVYLVGVVMYQQGKF